MKRVIVGAFWGGLGVLFVLFWLAVFAVGTGQWSEDVCITERPDDLNTQGVIYTSQHWDWEWTGPGMRCTWHADDGSRSGSWFVSIFS